MSHHEAHPVTREQLARLISKPVPKSLVLLCLVMALVGFAVFAVGAFAGSARAWQAFHFNWLFFTILSSAGVMMAAAQRITTARWSRPVIRMIEGFVAWLPIAFVLLVLPLLFGKRHIFLWVTDTPTVHEKQVWLEPTFFVVRDLAVYGLITLLSLWYVYRSVRLDVAVLPEWGGGWARGLRDRMRRGFGDERRELHSTHSMQGRLAVILALVFGFGWTVLAWDLSMSTNYHFQSTMYGWQVFMGGWLSMIMVWAILLPAWRNFMGAHEVMTEHHAHDIGKLAFAFTAFWGYLTFSQYLVIWYGNMAEETHHIRLRLIEPWVDLTVAMAVLAFAIPFFALLSKKAKTYAPTMILFAVCSLVGIWLHRYLEIYPSFYGVAEHLPFGLWEIAITIGFLGLWGATYIAFMNAFPRIRVFMLTTPYRDEVQVPVDPKTMEPLPAHE